MPKPNLTIRKLQQEARSFAKLESDHTEPSLYGVTDGKAVGTYFERKFSSYLQRRYKFKEGNVARGIDFPDLGVDIKVTSIKQPQSSCPYKSARQKIFGLGYSLLVFVYEKIDDHDKRTGSLDILHTVFISAGRTADYQTTRGIRQILDNDANTDDLAAFLLDRNLPIDEVQARQIAEELLRKKPEQGYLTISNALQWRLQYKRVIEEAGNVSGIFRIK